MAEHGTGWLVSTDWLAAHMNAPDLVIFDTSWHLPTLGRDARAEYEAEHIPGALFFDIDEIADTDVNLPHMLPSPEKFSSRMRRMGVGDGMRIVVYDSHGIYSAPRVWWTFQVMGKNDVAVLDGGLPKWKAEGRALEDMPPMKRSERHFTSRRNADLVRDQGDVAAAHTNGAAQIVDVRPEARFNGKEPEPRPGVRGGHIPNSLSLPFENLLEPDGTMKSDDDLTAAIVAAGVDLTKPVISLCGSGINAGILALALGLIGHRHTSVYDGSWAEWGAEDSALPVIV